MLDCSEDVHALLTHELAHVRPTIAVRMSTLGFPRVGSKGRTLCAERDEDVVCAGVWAAAGKRDHAACEHTLGGRRMVVLDVHLVEGAAQPWSRPASGSLAPCGTLAGWWRSFLRRVVGSAGHQSARLQELDGQRAFSRVTNHTGLGSITRNRANDYEQQAHA